MMTVIDTRRHLQQLLPLLNQSPIAMAEVGPTGTLRRVNPKAVQLMMPMAMHLGLPGDNLLDTLSGFIPNLRRLITDFQPNAGTILTQEPYVIHFSVGASVVERQFSLTVEKKSPDSLLIFLDDITDLLIKVEARRQ